MSKLRHFTRQLVDPNGDLVSVNERCSAGIIEGRAVVLKDGFRMIGYYDKWFESDKLQYIRDAFIQIMRDPRNAPDPDWTLLTV